MLTIEYNENEMWQELSVSAWKTRKFAKLVKSKSTKVGASLLTNDGLIYTGCNAQHKFRSHDIHAEINAICNMYSNSNSLISKMIIVAEREFLTPCGSCLDWIVRFSCSETKIGIQSRPEGEIKIFELNTLIPYYPK